MSDNRLLDKGHLTSLLPPHLFCLSHTHSRTLGLGGWVGAEASQLRSNKNYKYHTEEGDCPPNVNSWHCQPEMQRDSAALPSHGPQHRAWLADGEVPVPHSST